MSGEPAGGLRDEMWRLYEEWFREPSQRFTAVWIHRDGGWKALANHATTVVT